MILTIESTVGETVGLIVYQMSDKQASETMIHVEVVLIHVYHREQCLQTASVDISLVTN